MLPFTRFSSTSQVDIREKKLTLMVMRKSCPRITVSKRLRITLHIIDRHVESCSIDRVTIPSCRTEEKMRSKGRMTAEV